MDETKWVKVKTKDSTARFHPAHHECKNCGEHIRTCFICGMEFVNGEDIVCEVRIGIKDVESVHAHKSCWKGTKEGKERIYGKV